MNLMHDEVNNSRGWPAMRAKTRNEGTLAEGDEEDRTEWEGGEGVGKQRSDNGDQTRTLSAMRTVDRDNRSPRRSEQSNKGQPAMRVMTPIDLSTKTQHESIYVQRTTIMQRGTGGTYCNTTHTTTDNKNTHNLQGPKAIQLHDMLVFDPIWTRPESDTECTEDSNDNNIEPGEHRIEMVLRRNAKGQVWKQRIGT